LEKDFFPVIRHLKFQLTVKSHVISNVFVFSHVTYLSSIFAKERNQFNMKIIISTRTSTKEIDLKDNATLTDLKLAYSGISKKSIHRISFKKVSDDGKAERLDKDNKTLKDYGISDGETLQFKDLGPQIDYATVFVVEYAGPLFIVLLYALRPSIVFGAEANKKPYHIFALLALASWTFHFVKREFETFFVHQFSHPTMPLANLFKNSIYYWTFAAFIGKIIISCNLLKIADVYLQGYPLCSPNFIPPSDIQVYSGFIIFATSEIGNLICHLMLRNLREATGDIFIHNILYMCLSYLCLDNAENLCFP